MEEDVPNFAKETNNENNPDGEQRFETNLLFA